MKLPEIHVMDQGSMGYSVNWRDEDENKRYHIWLNAEGLPTTDVIHSNPIVREKKYGGSESRHLSQSAKKWAPIVASIIEKIKAEGLIEKAQKEKEIKEQAEYDERIHKRNEDALASLDRALLYLTPEIADSIRGLPRITRLAFVATFKEKP